MLPKMHDCVFALAVKAEQERKLKKGKPPASVMPSFTPVSGMPKGLLMSPSSKNKGPLPTAGLANVYYQQVPNFPHSAVPVATPRNQLLQTPSPQEIHTTVPRTIDPSVGHISPQEKPSISDGPLSPQEKPSVSVGHLSPQEKPSISVGPLSPQEKHIMDPSVGHLSRRERHIIDPSSGHTVSVGSVPAFQQGSGSILQHSHGNSSHQSPRPNHVHASQYQSSLLGDHPMAVGPPYPPYHYPYPGNYPQHLLQYPPYPYAQQGNFPSQGIPVTRVQSPPHSDSLGSTHATPPRGHR